MIDDQQMLRLFGDFQSIRRQTAGNLGKRILRPDYELPDRTRGFETMRFVEMARGYTPQLLGETNRFLIDIHHAESWFKVAQQLEEEDRVSLIWEFAEPHLELAIGRPYSLRSLFVFAAAHLLHQSDFLRVSNWKDDLPPDRKINYTLLRERAGLCSWQSWNTFPSFMAKLDQLNDEAFTTATGNFRNKSQHRYKLRFDRGLTPVVERIDSGKGVAYHFGFFPPLDIEQLVPLLYNQHQNAVNIFSAYWQLVNELCSAWDKKYAQS